MSLFHLHDRENGERNGCDPEFPQPRGCFSTSLAEITIACHSPVGVLKSHHRLLKCLSISVYKSGVGICISHTFAFSIEQQVRAEMTVLKPYK